MSETGNNNDGNNKKRSSNETVEAKPEMAAVGDDKGSDRKEDPTANKSTYIEKDVVEDEALYKSLQKMPFYHGFLPREDLQTMLSNEGDYLIRVSEVASKPKKDGQTSIKRDIILSLMSSDRGATESEHNQKDTKSENNPGDLKLRNMVIRRYDGMFGIKAGTQFATIDALLANYHVSNTLETKENRILKTPIELQPWESKHSAVKLGDKLGEGAYGEVRKGVLQRKEKQYNVAVKLMKGSGDMNKIKIREMMREARLMRNFKHRNVVRFYGVAVVEQPLYILLELVNGGALNTYLQKNKDVSKLELMNMCLGAALGLQYLHAHRCIHRDIAARNCLYSIDKIVKLSDFGLSLIAQEYKLCSSQKLPIKWLAPETITTLFFTHKTDVYSYGVMCFEIFNEGEEPWDGISNTEAKRNVVHGRHLVMPESCPEKLRLFIHEKIYVVDPKRRIAMDDVVRFIEPIISEMHNAAAAHKSERVTRAPADCVRSVMMPAISMTTTAPTPRNNASSSSKSKINRKKAAANKVAQTPKQKKQAHPGNHNMVEK
ncbi:unnamed protein product [Caenorhabditis sp. 36 PRJEB53466]|nr:unnamed protein product [Caenorhabditis sp. 36 PRJEB53466]